MRGAETAKTMLPCRRDVHLHELASFKMIFERPKQNKNDATNHPRTIEKSTWRKKQMRGNIDQCYPTYAKFADSGSRVGASCLVDSRCGAFFCDLFFGTFWEVPPWTNFDLPVAPSIQFSLTFRRC